MEDDNNEIVNEAEDILLTPLDKRSETEDVTPLVFESDKPIPNKTLENTDESNDSKTNNEDYALDKEERLLNVSQKIEGGSENTSIGVQNVYSQAENQEDYALDNNEESHFATSQEINGGSGNTAINNQYNTYQLNKSFKDLTKDWSLNDKRQHEVTVSEHEIENIIKELKDSRLIMLYSEDDLFLSALVEDVVSKLSKNKDYKNNETRIYWKGGRDNKNEFEEREPITIDSFLQSSFKQDKPTFINVRLSELDFLYSLHVTNKEQYDALVSGLITNNLFLICKLNRSLYQSLNQNTNTGSQFTLSQFKKGNKFTFKEISYVEAYLKYHFPKESKLYKNIVTQLEKGFWGNDKTEEGLRDYIENTYKGEPEKVKEAITKRNHSNYKNNQVKSLEALPFHEEPYRTILFIVSFFSDINITDFNKLVYNLLKGTIIIKEQVDVEDGIRKNNSVENEINALSFWKDNQFDILNKCHVIARESQKNTMSFRFLEISTDDVQNHFKKYYSLYLVNQLEKVIENDVIFFNKESSNTMLQKGVVFIMAMSAFDADKYIYEFLTQSYYKLHHLDWKINLDTKIILKGVKLEDVKPLELIKTKDRIVFRQFLNVIHELLKGAVEIRTHVFKFLEVVCKESSIDHILFFLKEFSRTGELNEIKHLRSVLGNRGKINFFELIRRVLNSGKDTSKYNPLFQILDIEAKRRAGDLQSSLELIHSWLPITNFSDTDLQLYATFYIYEIGNPRSSRFPLKRYGEYPPQLPVLKPVIDDNKSVQYFCFLITWLFKNIEENIKSERIHLELMKLRALILESWLLVIMGIDQEEDVMPEKNAIRDNFIEALQETLDKKTKRRLQIAFNAQVGDYSREIIKHKKRAKTEGEAIIYTKENDQSITFLELYEAKKTTTLYIKTKL